jgi:hypothetical protein
LLGRLAGPKSWVAGAVKAVAACCWRTGLLVGLRGPRLAVGLEGGKGLRDKEKGFSILAKGLQTIEFKFEFEFQQPKIMHQHECHK